MSRDPDLFDAANSRQARDEALASVGDASAQWMVRAKAAVEAIAAGWEGTGEDIRAVLLTALPPPHHHNVWGALINGCVRGGLLEWTGELRNMRTVTSHARSTKVYRRT